MQTTIGTTLQSEVQPWRNHIILCGLNNLALRILEQLETAGVQVVVIDDKPDEKLAKLLQQRNYPLLREDSRRPDILQRAGIERAMALISVHGDDLDNLETVLAADELRPGLRVVGRFFNQAIGERLMLTLKNMRSISLSEKAGPEFVSAALPGRIINIFDFAVNGKTANIAVAELTVEKHSQLGEDYADLTVPAIYFAPHNVENTQATRRNYQYIPAPSKQTSLKPGDRVMVMGRMEEMIAHPLVGLKADEIAEMRQVQEVTAGAPVSRQVQRKARVGQARSVFFRVLRQAARSFRYALLLMLIIMLTGTIVFRFFYRNVDPLTGVSSNLDWFTALYFTVTIMSTTGFGDFNLATQDVPLKIFGIFMMLTGAGTVAILYSFLTNFLITLRLDEEVGRQVATEMENHVVMCGLGTIGYQMLKGLLERGQRVVVIEPQTDGRFNAEIKALGVPVIVGDARSPEIMRLVNIKKARCIAIMTSNDLTNLEIALGARQQRPDIRVVLRLFDRTLADRVERTFDIHIARSASAIAAPAFVAEVFDYQQLSSFYVENVPFTAAQETVTLGGDLNGLTIGEVCRRTGVTILVHQERLAAVTLEKQHEGKSDFGELTLNFHPDDGTRLQEGDILVYVGPYDSVIKLHLLNNS